MTKRGHQARLLKLTREELAKRKARNERRDRARTIKRKNKVIPRDPQRQDD